MNKIGKIFITTAFIFALFTDKAHASSVARTSASLTIKLDNRLTDKRAELLKAYLEERKSPLANEAKTFVFEADKYNLDYRLLTAIAGVESWYGTLLPENSYNGWGWGIYGNNVKYFTSWKDAIHTITRGLREQYMDKWGAEVIKDTDPACKALSNGDNIVTIYRKPSCLDFWKTIDKQYIYNIGKIYAADPLWPQKVLRQMQEIESFEANWTNTAISISI